MKNIIIIGSRGYECNYGGWETFVKGFVDNNHDEVNFYIPKLITGTTPRLLFADNTFIWF